MSKETKALKYLSVLPDKKKQIVNIYKDYQVTEHIEELYDLIDYQMKLISDQRRQIVADKHKDAWKHYYKSLEEYNESERRYFTEEELKARKC
jgi:hypothetical protein